MEVMQGNPARTAELRKLSYVGLTMVETNLLQIGDRRLRLIAMSYSIYHRQGTCIICPVRSLYVSFFFNQKP
jgi:hypothetical protein